MTETDRWYDAEYPWDMAKCGLCLTMHLRRDCLAHPDLKEALQTAGFEYSIPVNDWEPELCDGGVKALSTFREKAIEIREHFKHYWNATPDMPL